ncbi:hypothetical protein HPB47_016243 [Ixodes persulcatus]|uniref:Uncharacterized protein n=1 Tax=Ixodes persulcatus TaxID=34615 RepID=A0AC60QRD5_IXOPE|nr:hypothetical protein HPB47_016243 [Ixodes persulcatus]
MVTQMNKDKLWAEFVAELNAIGPAVKDRRRWQHYWTDRVRAAKKKADEFRKNSGGQQRLMELAVARLAALEQQTSAIRQLPLVLLLVVLMTSATRQPGLPLPCKPLTPTPLD